MRAAKALSSLLHEVSHEQHIAPEAAVRPCMRRCGVPTKWRLLRPHAPPCPPAL